MQFGSQVHMFTTQRSLYKEAINAIKQYVTVIIKYNTAKLFTPQLQESNKNYRPHSSH